MEFNPSVDFEAFLAEWLNDITTGSPSSVERGRRFAQKLFAQWQDMEASASDLLYCDGSGDGGIDLAYLERGEDDGSTGETSGHTWYLLQSKYGTAFRGSDTLLSEGQKIVDTLDGKRERLSSLAEGLLERLHTFRRSASERDRIVVVFATERNLDDAQRRALQDLRAMGRARLGALFDVDSVSVETVYQRNLEEAALAAAKRLTVSITGNLVPSGKDLLVGSIPLLDLYAFLKAYRDATGDLDQLYERNVRRFLGGRRKVNKGIQETLREAPERFGLYNNGITIVVSGFETAADGSTSLTEPFIVNGCQTTRTIWEVFSQRLEAGGTGENPELTAWRARAAQGMVVTKIASVGAAGDDLLRAITRYTNSQNAVREQDFIALTSDFRTWAQEMANRHGFYLEIQRGGWDSRRALQKQKPEIQQFSEWANAFDLLKVYGAGWLAEAGLAFGKNPPFLPNGAIFERIVSREGVEEGEHFGVDDLYAAYLLRNAADGFGFGRGAEKASRRQTRFLFYFVAIELLREVFLRSELRPSHRALSNAIIKLARDEHQETRARFLETAIEAIDGYMTQGSENSVHDEPAFKDAFNYDLNAFLKWEKLGKSEESCPRFRQTLAVTRMMMGQKVGGHPSVRETVARVINS